jgi:precorrin-2/cobalt-factor-2 C20-methyltransferase
MKRFGTLHGVGVGPGDPQLITFKGAEIIHQSKVIAYVVDEKNESIARRIAQTHLPDGIQELPLFYSMNPARETRVASRQEAAETILKILAAGDDVTFITEGDPLIYSTFQHLLSAMPAEAPLDICPGVSSFTAAAAEAHFSLAVEGETMLIAAATTEAMQNLVKWAEQFDVVVLYKIHRQIQQAMDILKTIERPIQATIVERASIAGRAKVVELNAWDGKPLPYFTILLIRSVESQ